MNRSFCLVMWMVFYGISASAVSLCWKVSYSSGLIGDEHQYNLSSFKMKISRIYLFLCMNFVATVVAYYRRCYDSFSLCLITNTTDDPHDPRNSKFRLTRWSAAEWCEDQSSMLAIITNENVQSAIDAVVRDPSAKMVDSHVLTNGYRFNLNAWEWVTGRQSVEANNPSSDRTNRYAYLTVTSDGLYIYYSLSDGPSTWKLKFICSYFTYNINCSSGFRQLGSRCYKIHHGATTWYDARNICLKEESDLATFEDGLSSLSSVSLWNGQYWIGLRNESWDWLNHQKHYGEIKYSNWEDENPHSTGGDCLCLNASTGRWTNCDCFRTFCYICIQDYVSGSISNVTTTQTTRIATTTTKLKTKTPTTEFGDSTSQFHSTPNRTQSGDSAVVVESGQPSDFLPFLGIGIACLLILIVVIVVVVFMKNRRSRADDREPKDGNSPPSMTYKDDAPSTVYAAVIPNTNDQVYSASEKNSNQTVYAELDLESKRSTGPTQRVSVKVRFTSEETPGQAVYAEVNQVPKKNMSEKAEGPSVYDNYNQLMVDSVYANSAQTKV